MADMDFGRVDPQEGEAIAVAVWSHGPVRMASNRAFSRCLEREIEQKGAEAQSNHEIEGEGEKTMIFCQILTFLFSASLRAHVQSCILGAS